MKNFHINLSLESSYAIQTCFNKSKNQTEPQCYFRGKRAFYPKKIMINAKKIFFYQVVSK